jgi:hypothetical protein
MYRSRTVIEAQRQAVMRTVKPGDTVIFNPAQHRFERPPLRKGMVVEVSKPDRLKGRKGGGVLLRVNGGPEEWISFHQIVRVRHPSPVA